MSLIYYLICTTILVMIKQYYYRKNKSIKISRLFRSVILIGILLPIIEESIFRHTLIYYTQQWSFYKELNILIFSLVHITNIFIKDYYDNKLECILQVIYTIFVGYYLINVDLSTAIYTHIILNTYSIMCTYLFTWIFLQPMAVVECYNKEYHHVYKNKLRKCISSENIDDGELVYIKNIPKEYDDMFKRFITKMNNRRSNSI